MASISFRNFKIDVEIRNIDGVFQSMFEKPFPKGFWILMTIKNDSGDNETYPRVDDEGKVKTFSTYDEALDDISILLKQHFR